MGIPEARRLCFGGGKGDSGLEEDRNGSKVPHPNPCPAPESPTWATKSLAQIQVAPIEQGVPLSFYMLKKKKKPSTCSNPMVHQHWIGLGCPMFKGAEICASQTDGS